MDIVKAENVSYEYNKYNEEGKIVSKVKAIDSLNMTVKKGQFIAILGANGSGKSTFAKHINALLKPSDGTVFISGYDTKDDNKTLDVRQSAGMVFQNPDNQIIASVVEEDVGFGPENIGIKTEEIWERVESSLKKVDMLDYRYYSPNKLSGGQKQRVAIAGVLAMKPSCIILDESTAMLDPGGRKEIIDSIRELNRKENITIILITHYMDETTFADNIFVMNKGKVVMNGTPQEVFLREDELEKYNLELPQVAKLSHELIKNGVPLERLSLTEEDLVEQLDKILK